MPLSDWHLYSEERPPEIGVYEWSVAHKRLEGLRVRVLARYRKRIAGYHDAFSPAFDDWDGYKVIVPPGSAWRYTTEGEDLGKHSVRLIKVENVSLDPCPFCKQVPKFHGSRKTSDGGFIIGADPHEYNNWWLICCRWVKTPHFPDPRELAEARNLLIRNGEEKD